MAAALVTTTLNVACRREVSAAEMKQTASASAASGPEANTPVAAQFDESAFTLKLEPRAPYAVGTPGVVILQLKAKEPHHINQEYPHKLKLKASDGVTYPQPILSRQSMKIAPMQADLTVPLTPNRSGELTISGEFAFSLCTADRCLIEKRTLAVAINVK